MDKENQPYLYIPSPCPQGDWVYSEGMAIILRFQRYVYYCIICCAASSAFALLCLLNNWNSILSMSWSQGHGARKLRRTPVRALLCRCDVICSLFYVKTATNARLFHVILPDLHEAQLLWCPGQLLAGTRHSGRLGEGHPLRQRCWEDA